MSCIWTPRLHAQVPGSKYKCILVFTGKNAQMRRLAITVLSAASQESHLLLLTPHFALGADSFLLTDSPHQQLWPIHGSGWVHSTPTQTEAVLTGTWEWIFTLCLKLMPQSQVSCLLLRSDHLLCFTSKQHEHEGDVKIPSQMTQIWHLWLAQLNWYDPNLQWNYKITCISYSLCTFSSHNYSPSCSGSVEACSSKTIRGVYFKACRQHVLITKQGHYAILLS